MSAPLALAQSQPASVAELVLLALLVLAAGALVASALSATRLLRQVLASSEATRERLDELAARLKKLEAERSDIDLRRTEHVLIDIRDGLKGLEDAVLEAASRPTVIEREVAVPAPDGPPEPAPDPADLVVERLHNRLAALGYDRVQLLGDRELYGLAATGRAEVPVEARRVGVVHKGRCVVEKGRVLDVRMDPPYGLFP